MTCPSKSRNVAMATSKLGVTVPCVTGALGTDEISVHHVWSWSAGTFTTSSSLLVCSSKVILLEDISTKLYRLANIEEVTNVMVQDVDECSAPQLNSCSQDANCTNTIGSYSCICHHGYHDLNPSKPGTVCKAPSVTTQACMNTTPPPWTTNSLTDYTPEIMSILSYNVTGSVFHVEWTTNIQNGVTFHLVLLNETNEIQNLTVVSYNWTFTDLSPAILYTVRVTPAACGNEGTTKEIKVRTGKYNSSNLNISSVSSALMESLQNSTYDVDSSSIYIADSDECFQNETDCSPWAYCINTFGSYICDCWSGYTDSNPRRQGRSCAASTQSIHPTTNYPGVSSGSTATATTTSSITNPSISSTVSTTHVKSNSTTTVSSISTATNGRTTVPISTPTMTLTPTTQNSVRTATRASNTTGHLISYVSVECSPGYVTVNIRRDVLKDNNIPESSLYLGKPDCGLSGADNTYVWLTTSWKMCGTTFANNGTHNFANVTLYNNVSGLSSLRLEVPVICTYPSRFFISTGYAPSGYFDIINDPVAGSGSFQVILRLLNGTFPLPDDYIFSPEEEVFLEVEVNTTISQVNVIIDTCWATSSNDSTKPPQDFFMEKGCPASNAYTTVLQNGNGTVSLLSVQIFKFVKQYIIYLHCQIQICVEIQQGSCRSDILSTDNLFLFVFLKTSVQRAASNTLQTIGFVLLGIGVFLLSLAVIAGLAYHKRKIGNYNFRFKPQQQNFTYHVFDT
ncbi:uromodulin-like 1 [Labeo rohita]|uniref:Uromodulin-like 1 n=1 Tax=Labeo rohita TaxID=84645 RepID=A0A498L7X4_LABRO|nr:uromodulin-like 1 [Labeo rohita]